MVHSQQTPPPAHFQGSGDTSSCRYNSMAQQYPPPAYPTLTQQDFANQIADFSQTSQQDRLPEWLQNGYYPSPAHPMLHGMYQYRYNPYSWYQMYDYNALSQTVATSSSPQMFTSPAASISPVSSTGSTSPLAEQHQPSANFDWMKPSSYGQSRGMFTYIYM